MQNVRSVCEVGALRPAVEAYQVIFEIASMPLCPREADETDRHRPNV